MRRRRHRWASITEKKVAVDADDDDDAAVSDIIINLGNRRRSSRIDDRRSISENVSDYIDDTHYRLQSLGIIVSKGSSGLDIL